MVCPLLPIAKQLTTIVAIMIIAYVCVFVSGGCQGNEYDIFGENEMHIESVIYPCLSTKSRLLPNTPVLLPNHPQII